MDKNNLNTSREKINFFSVLQSTVAAALGVQSEKNRQRDFSHGKASTFIIAGIIFLVVFVVAVYSVVQIVLSTAQN